MPVRTLLSLVAAVLSGLAGPAAADPFRMISVFSVERPRERPTEPLLKGRVEGAAGNFYGGFRGRTVPLAEHSAAFDIYVGVRPRLGTLDVDVGYSRHVTDEAAGCCGTFALRLDREIGQSAELGAQLRMDPAGESGRAEARAEVHIFERTRIQGTLGHNFDGAGPEASAVTFDFGATRPLGTGASLDLRYRDASYRPGRAEVSVKVRF